MWRIAYFCRDCVQEMSWGQHMNNHGVCPYCGYRRIEGDTIVDCFERSYKKVRMNPIYKFWKQQYKRVYRDQS